MKEEKLKQLRKVFEIIIKEIISNVKLRHAYFDSNDYIQRKASQLVYEVKVRMTDRKE